MTHPIKAAVSIETTDTKGFFYNPRHYKYHEVKIDTPAYMKAGLSYTASGYGFRIPTQYMVRRNNKWRRVYACCFSNVSTLYIGPSLERGHIVEIG